jgi:hypothetical protein
LGLTRDTYFKNSEGNKQRWPFIISSKIGFN